MPRTDKFPFRSDLRAKLIDTATRGKTIQYRELGAGRAMIGRFLVRIANEEALAGRPPLTSVVVRKDTGKPGEGFRQAMIDAGFIDAANTEDERLVWQRAVRECYEFWRPKLNDDLRQVAPADPPARDQEPPSARASVDVAGQLDAPAIEYLSEPRLPMYIRCHECNWEGKRQLTFHPHWSEVKRHYLEAHPGAWEAGPPKGKYLYEIENKTAGYVVMSFKR